MNIQGTLDPILSFPYFIPIPGIIVLRIWYLYSGRTFGRVIVAVCFAASIAVDVVLVARDWPRMGFLYDSAMGCVPKYATNAWELFVHHLVLHSVLYVAATVPAVQSWYREKHSPLASHILREYVDHAFESKSQTNSRSWFAEAVYSTSPY